MIKILFKILLTDESFCMSSVIKQILLTAIQAVIALLPQLYPSLTQQDSTYIFSIVTFLLGLVEWIKRKLTTATVANALYSPIPQLNSDMKQEVKKAMKK
jgi:hypothetical protein